MKNLLQSVVLAEIARIAELTPSQTLRVASWLLDHDVRFVPQEARSISVPTLAPGMTVELFQALRDLCLQDKRISAIKELRAWAIENGPDHPLCLLKTAKDFIDEHFPRGEHPGRT